MNASDILSSKFRRFALVFALLLKMLTSFSQNPNQAFNAGAYIVDMGQNSSLNVGLKPYGFVYAMIQAHVPVYWSINSSKSKDGVDFTLPVGAGGKIYSGGPFIVSAEAGFGRSRHRQQRIST